MAQKEVTVYIVDLGLSMGEKRHGREISDLEWGLEFVWDKITTTVATGRKTALISVIGARTDETDLQGVMEDDTEGYGNLTVFSKPKQYLLEDIRRLPPILKPSSTNDGDLVSAITIAIQMISNATTNKAGNPLQFARKIVVVTDGRGYIDTEDLEGIAQKIKDDDAPIEVTLLGVDFDDPDNGYKEEDKESRKEKNETILKQFVEDGNGNFGTLAVAIDQLEIPRLKETRPVPSYRGLLTLNDPSTYDDSITIDVERFPCTNIAKPPTASSFVVRTDFGGDAPESSTQSSATMAAEEPDGGRLSAVRHQRVYQVDNLDEPGVKINVEQDEVERGFEYGRTAVHISHNDENIVKLETQKSLELIGFILQEKFERYLPMSRTNFIVPQRANGQARLALSSFIHALYEAEMYAIARLVTKDGSPPVIILLVPRIEPDWEALVDVELPFEEDMRRYKFPPLDRKLTVSGKTITEHRDLPNADLVNAMSDYVDAMDISKFDRDDDGEPTEYAKFEDTYSPLLHRVSQIIRWRATHPDPTLPLPGPSPILTKYSTPPSELLEKSSKQLTALKAAADVKKVPPKTRGRGNKRRREDREKPLSGLDVDALLGNPKRLKIDASNLIPSFKQALLATEDLDAIQEAATVMGNEIRSLISNSVGGSAYGRALEAIRVMREEITELEEPDMYNEFINNLKNELLQGKLGGERREMWWKIRGSKYGLVDRKRCFASTVGEDEAAEFYKG